MKHLILPEPIAAYLAADRPVDLQYLFHTERGLITSLEIIV